MSPSTVETEPQSRPPPGDEHAFFGQARGLPTLSGLKAWERFSFLGVQATLVLSFADTVAHGGIGMSVGVGAGVGMHMTTGTAASVAVSA